jgi:hypothetical protein
MSTERCELAGDTPSSRIRASGVYLVYRATAEYRVISHDIPDTPVGKILMTPHRSSA